MADFSWALLRENFHFLRPLWLLAIPLAVLAYWLLLRARARAAAWEALCDPRLLQWLTRGQGTGTVSRWPWHALLTAWLLALLALAGPSWERQQHEGFVKQWPRVFVLDLSAAMLAPDLAPSRLSRARFKLADLLERTSDEQVALVNFSGAAFIAAPLTQDAKTISSLLEALHPNIMPVGGHDAATGLREAGELIHQAGMNQGEIILITDHVAPSAIDEAGSLALQGIRTSVLGLGSEAGAPIPLQQGFLTNDDGSVFLSKLDEASLQQLAQAGDGRYARITADDRDIDWLLGSDLLSPGQFARAKEKQQLEVWLERGPWLVLLLLPLGLFGFRRGWLWLLLPCLILPTPRAEAGLWQDLWQRRDQQAREYLDAGEAQKARGLTEAPQYEGEAAYRSGDFSAAVEQYTQDDSAQGDFNRGNALARSGQLEQAIAAYDDALAKQADFADAEFNKKLLEELLKQQQQQQQQQGEGEQDQDQQEQQDQQNQDKQDSDSDDQQQQDQQQDQDSESDDSQSDSSQSDDAQSEDAEDQDSQSQQDQESEDQEQEQQSQDQQSSAEEQEQQRREQEQQQQQSEAEQQAEQQQAQLQQQELSEEERQQLQAMEQWLRRVPDDPGGLLRAKFQLEYLRKRQQDGKK